MKREEIKVLKEKVEKPYECIKRTIYDIRGVGYSYWQVSLIKGRGYWAMNTDNKLYGNWAIKIGSEFVKKANGIEEALKELKELNK